MPTADGGFQHGVLGPEAPRAVARRGSLWFALSSRSSGIRTPITGEHRHRDAARVTAYERTAHRRGETTPAAITVDAEPSGAGGRPRYAVTVLVDGVEHVAIEDDAFDALSAVRLELERDGWLLGVEGARGDVWPSGMARDQGGGLRAYRLRRGRTPRSEDLVDVFAPATEHLAIVAEQRLAVGVAPLAPSAAQRTRTMTRRRRALGILRATRPLSSKRQHGRRLATRLGDREPCRAASLHSAMGEEPRLRRTDCIGLPSERRLPAVISGHGSDGPRYEALAAAANDALRSQASADRAHGQQCLDRRASCRTRHLPGR